MFNVREYVQLKVRLGQAKLGQVRLGQVRLGQVRVLNISDLYGFKEWTEGLGVSWVYEYL